MLLAWLGETHRPTRDVDLLGLGELSDDTLLRYFKHVCELPVDRDGMEYDSGSLRVSDIREGDPYGGRRVTLTGTLGSGRIRIQVDVGLGDATEPPPEWLDYPALLDFPAPRLRAYRPESVVAEKLESMVRFGAVNTRLKDFYDVHMLGQVREFDLRRLAAAVRATFDRRRTPLPDRLPVALDARFATEERQRQWAAFLANSGIHDAPQLQEVTSILGGFLAPVIAEARSPGTSPATHWGPGGPWMGEER